MSLLTRAEHSSSHNPRPGSRRGVTIAALLALLAVGVATVFAASLNVSLGSGFAAGSAQVEGGCDDSVNLAAQVANTPVAGTYPMSAVAVSDIATSCDGDVITLTALTAEGDVVGVAYAYADATGSRTLTFDPVLPDASAVDRFAVVIKAGALPTPPTITAATPGNTTASIAFTAGETGTATITNYQFSLDGGLTWTTSDPAVTTSPLVLTGLTNNVEYSVTIRPLLSTGTGATSNTVTVTPVAEDENTPADLVISGDNTGL